MASRLLRVNNLLALPLLLWLAGCGDGGPRAKDEPQPVAPPAAQVNPPSASNPKINEIMRKISAPGPQSLQNSLVEAIKKEQPAWQEIQSTSKEYARLAAELSGYEPIKGSSGSWKELTKAFTDSANELDRASQAKEKEKVSTALDTLGGTCMECHRRHRIMRPPGGPIASPGGK